MNERHTRSILLATDLGCRSDRALDRAVLLAKAWNARLVAVTVLEPAPGAAAGVGTAALPGDDELQRRFEDRLRADAGADAPPIRLRLERGPVAATIVAVALEEGCELLVLGIARDALSDALLGGTVDHVVGRSPLPLLVVRQRPRSLYPRLVVASDFSPVATRALVAAAGLFPAAEVLLFHAHSHPPALSAAGGAKARHEALALARRDADAHVEAAKAQSGAATITARIEEGDAGLLLEAHGQAHRDDLVVLGVKPRHRLVNLLIGSVAQRILERAENDVLLVRAVDDDA